jgi:hypothetical protein
MKKLLFVLMAGSFIWTACEKDPIKEDQSPELDYFPMTVGNYWVYDTYKIDSNGNELLYGENDTTLIEKDTLIAGESYFKIRGKGFGYGSAEQVNFYRDSSGYIVDEKGTKVFSQNYFYDTLGRELINKSVTDTLFFWYWMTEPTDSVLFLKDNEYDDLINRKMYFHSKMAGDEWVNNYSDRLYGAGVGILTFQYFYASSQKKWYFEKRLVDCSIKE